MDGEDEEKECDSDKTQPPESGLNCIINPAVDWYYYLCTKL